MGHLPIVTEASLDLILSTGHLGTTGVLGKMWRKTLADMFADLLVARAGDLVFPWSIRDPVSGAPGRGFGFQLAVAGRPILSPSSPFPLQLPLSKVGQRWVTPISEADALELFADRPLWNAIGKKALGRGRSLTHQSPLEDAELLRRLGADGVSVSVPVIPPTDGQPITISLEDRVASPTAAPSSLAEVDVSQLFWVSSGRFVIEKALEAWLCEVADTPAAATLWACAIDEPSTPSWFANYLPFGVQGSSVDFVATFPAGGSSARDRCVVLELKKDPLSASEFSEASGQVGTYATFVRRAFSAFGRDFEVTPVVLSAKTKLAATQSPRGASRLAARASSVRWVTYQVESDATVRFERER